MECGIPEQNGDGTGLKIRFPEEYKAVAGLAMDRREDLTRHLEKRVGFKVRIDILVDETAKVPEVTSRRIEMENRKRACEEEAKNHPLVMKAKSDLGASLKGIQLISSYEKS